MVFNDAVVDQCHTPGAAGSRLASGSTFRAGEYRIRPVAEVRMRVVQGGRAVRCPAGVRNAQPTFQMGRGDLLNQLSHARGAAGSLQAIVVHGHPAGVVAPILQPLQALDQNRNDVAG